MSDNEQAIAQARETWAAGDFGVTARRAVSASAQTVEAAGITDGETVLDVACGTGNSAIPAAKLGARVTALDLVAHLLEQGRAAASDAGVEIDWVEGNAQDLPFDAESFDVVISVFGCMFAPDHQAAASEIGRVLKPGGRISICAWTPDSTIASMFRNLREHMPPPPPDFKPPPLWGDPDHVKDLFQETGIEVAFERGAVDFQFESPNAALEELSTYFGPMVKLKEAKEADGTWPEVQEKLLATLEEDNVSTDGDLRYSATYQITTGTK